MTMACQKGMKSYSSRLELESQLVLSTRNKM